MSKLDPQMLEQVFQHVAELRHHVARLTHAHTAPKRIVRDETGRPVAIEVVPPEGADKG